jgi:hypothetical protein
MYFRKKGYSAIDAQGAVFKVHYDYSKQNKFIKEFVPFYFWNSKNIPQEFANMFIKPAKYATLGKVVGAPYNEVLGYDDATEDATAEWARGAGVFIGEVNGIPLVVNVSQLPPFAMQELLGLLNSRNGSEAISQSLRAIGGMTEPFIQVTAEQIANADFFIGKPIVSGGKGVMPERGIKEFMGIDIQDKPWAQRMVHISEGFATPLGVVRTAIRVIDEMPMPAYTAKLLMGVPLGLNNEASADFLSYGEEINGLDAQIKHLKAIEDRTKPDYEYNITRQKILGLYKNQLNSMRNGVSDILEQQAVLNNEVDYAKKEQNYEQQKVLQDALTELMKAYQIKSRQSYEVKRELKRQIDEALSQIDKVRK